jgi:hypothetical protein
MEYWLGFLDLKRDNVRGLENTIMFGTAHKILYG